jgi:hypothetical protein
MTVHQKPLQLLDGALDVLIKAVRGAPLPKDALAGAIGGVSALHLPPPPPTRSPPAQDALAGAIGGVNALRHCRQGCCWRPLGHCRQAGMRLRGSSCWWQPAVWQP